MRRSPSEYRFGRFLHLTRFATLCCTSDVAASSIPRVIGAEFLNITSEESVVVILLTTTKRLEQLRATRVFTSRQAYPTIMSIEIQTPLGNIKLRLRPDSAPKTVEYVARCVQAKLYDGRCFYR